MVGFVRDTEGLAVSGARVYLVPAGDIPSGALALTDVAAERASTLDEPLEDTIAERGGAYLQGLTDTSGFYRIPGIAPGRYFVVEVPGDARHLPGGSLCRASRPHTALVDRQTDLLVSTAPSAAAQYVGPTTCYRCHPNTHDQKTLHMLGIRKIGAPGPLQDGARYPKWDQPLEKFKPAPDATTLNFYDYDGTAKDWKVSETPPSGASVSFTADLYRQDGAYKVRLTNKKAPGENSYQVDFLRGSFFRPSGNLIGSRTGALRFLAGAQIAQVQRKSCAHGVYLQTMGGRPGRLAAFVLGRVRDRGEGRRGRHDQRSPLDADQSVAVLPCQVLSTRTRPDVRRRGD